MKSLKWLVGATDLEAPTWTVPEWGSAALFELDSDGLLPDTSSSAVRRSDVTEGFLQKGIKIPTHLRYMPPTAGTGGYRHVTLPWPVIFWACQPDDESARSKNNKDKADTATPKKNPFGRSWLGYDNIKATSPSYGNETFFDEDTIFIHLTPVPATAAAATQAMQLDQTSHNISQNDLFLNLTVPVLDLDRARWVEAGTFAVVFVATVALLVQLAGVAWRDWRKVLDRSRAEGSRAVDVGEDDDDDEVKDVEEKKTGKGGSVVRRRGKGGG